MEKVIKGIKKFQEDVFPLQRNLFAELALGQDPKYLFITCSDSRIDPNLLTQTSPGELFICRNAGNIVPPHQWEAGGMTASIEFAVSALGIEHIIICGHNDCGAMKATLTPEALKGMPHVERWLGHAHAAAEIVKAHHGGCLGPENVPEITEQNVVLQLQHLRTHPAVAARLATRQIDLHGWVYDIETGGMRCYDETDGSFKSYSERYADVLESSAGNVRVVG